MGWFQSRKRQEREHAAALYGAAAAAARHPQLYEEYGVDDTVDGRFEMLSLHLFAVVHRLTFGPDPDPELARLTTEAFVVDMDATYRDIGVSDRRIPKRMKTLFSSYGGRLGAYGSALSAGGDALEGAIARNIFGEESDSNASRRLADYLRALLAWLDNVPSAALQEGRIVFPDPISLAAENS
ncbi:ubiquinol-cytochrome C chaperone family protein [Afifella aestuarii]|uniref:ubiquinol-cytochrome C chaperone family protein n=1 Tax=Afifella aestuarii TaxID=1909496 RepID=UPI000FE40FC4|nr:ubiquinol-cytochrome C chaperone family protein [Afifella aestuarii]